MEIGFVKKKKRYVIGYCKCHFVFQHIKIHEEELNVSKKVFSRRAVQFLMEAEIVFVRIP
jgi:hypothetical protein